MEGKVPTQRMKKYALCSYASYSALFSYFLHNLRVSCIIIHLTSLGFSTMHFAVTLRSSAIDYFKAMYMNMVLFLMKEIFLPEPR